MNSNPSGTPNSRQKRAMAAKLHNERLVLFNKAWDQHMKKIKEGK